MKVILWKALCVLCVLCGSRVGAAERPNIVVLFADDMGFSDIGCFGSEIETPRLDRLAADGLRFTHFYNTGRCCPSRASILTGLYSHQADIGHMAGDIGVPGYRDRLSFNAVTLAEVLGASGYHTIMTGKWHLGWRDEGSPTARGFQHFYGTRGFIDSYFTIVPHTEIYLGEKVVLPVTETPVNHLKPDEEWYTTDVFTDYALHFIEEVRKQDDHPFFLYLAYNAPHFPLHAKPEDVEKYRGRYRDGWAKFREARSRRLVELGILGKGWELSPPDVPAWESLTEQQREDMDFKMALFAAIIDRLDRNIGRVVDHLKKIGELDNTLLVFVSDNGGTKETGLFGIKGEQHTVDNYNQWGRKGGWSSSYGQGWANLSNAPFRRYKRENHEGGVSAPCIVHWPEGIEAKGALRHQVAHLIDLMPTFVEVAGAEYPDKCNGHEIQPMAGRSLVPSFGEDAPEPRTLFWEHEGNRAVRDGDWKLVGSRKGPWELYHMRRDRTELRDLSSARPEKFSALEAKWDAWAEKVGVLIPDEFDAAKNAFNKKKQKPEKAAAAPDSKRNFLMCEPGDLLFSDDFDPDSVSARWFYKGEFALRGDALVRTKVDPDESHRVFLKDPEFHNTIVQFDFKYEGLTNDLRLVTGSGGHYNSVVQCRRDRFQVNTPVDREAGFMPSHIGECARIFVPGEWHTMTVEFWNDEIIAHVDGEHFVLGAHPIIDRTRTYFAFQFDRPSAAIDNVRVWQAAGQREDWPETRERLAQRQETRAPVIRDPVDRYKFVYTNVKSRLTRSDETYRRLVQRHDELQRALHDEYPEAFRTHKELSKSISATKQRLKATDPEFKPMESAVHKARRAEDAYVVSKNPRLQKLPAHRYNSELDLARVRLEAEKDPGLLALIAETARRQAVLESRFPEAFASVDAQVDHRNALRRALNDDPKFQEQNRAVADVLRAIKEYERSAEPRLVELEAASKAYQQSRD